MAKDNRNKKTGVAWYNRPAAKRTWKVFSVAMKCLFTVFLVFFVTGCLVAGIMAYYISNAVASGADVPELTTSGNVGTSVMLTYDEASDEWKEFMHLEGSNHIWADLKDIPANMQNAVIAIEDERFRQHDGVDWKRTASAVVNMVFKFSSVEYGGSTLTQQLVKQLTGDNDHTVMRKVTEIMKALELEKQYSKEEILEAYLNILPLSDNITGVGFGANYYFSKDVQDLSLAECAVLASITQNPSYYDPYRHPENVRDRQQTVLWKMFKLGFITEDEYNQAMGEELILSSNVSYVSVQDYYTDMVIESVIADLQEQYGYSYAQAENMIYYGGLRIYSWEDLSVQSAMERLYADESIYPDAIPGDEEDPRVAFFATDYNGKVITTVGDRGVKSGDRVTNISTMSKRQPGSSIKPIALYDLGIEYNLFNYSSRVADAPCLTVGGKPWPPNYGYSYAFDNGYTLLYLGLQQSLNTVATQVLNQVGLDNSYDFLTNVLGITTYVEDDINFSALGLGGATYGAYLSELTSAYQIFGNGGVYNGFYCYDKVENAQGEVILQTAPLGVQALSEDTSYVMNRLLQQVVRGNLGTLYKINGSWPGMEIFAKTGTTDANNDVLAVGGTPYYVAGCWFGYRYNNEMTYTQAQAVKTLWNEGMLLLNRGLPTKTFEHWGETKELTFCRRSGLLASSGCRDCATGVYRLSNIPATCTSCGSGAPKNTTKQAAETTKSPQTPLTTAPPAVSEVSVAQEPSTPPVESEPELPPQEVSAAEPAEVSVNEDVPADTSEAADTPVAPAE